MERKPLEMEFDFLDNLNEAQREAVVNTEGPALVIAGAGSGKTRVLTYRVAYLLKLGVDPFHILALTFTNKAAQEMKERIIKLVGTSDARNVWMGTFHSIFARILRIHGHLLGYPSNFTIYDNDDSKSLIRSIIREMKLDQKVYQPSTILSRISACKNNLISHEEYNNDPELTEYDQRAGRPMTGQIFTAYNLRCRKAQAMDFDDLLFNMYVLLRDFPEILLRYQNLFRYILVDEFQDTNHVQYMIVKKLAARHENICVVGDDAQSIYSFRGANIQNILNFKYDFPDVKLFKLEQNYRSTKNIVNAANSVIINNKNQIFKKIWTHNEEGPRLRLIKATSDSEEGQLVAGHIFETKMTWQLPNSHFAILYRTNAQSRSFEEALRRLNIPYRVYGGLSFYKRKEIKDLLAYFRLVVNPNDEEALKRIINYPARGIGETTLDKLIVAAGELNLPVWTLMENLHHYNLRISPSIQNRIAEFVTLIKKFSLKQKKTTAYDLAVEIARESGLLKELDEDKTPEGISRMENINELLNGIKEFSDKGSTLLPDTPDLSRTLDRYLQEISLLTDEDTDEGDDQNKVALMTIHSAKGLEFPYVYIVGLEENLFPSYRSLNSREDLEEERRLFYVALTRAQKQAILSYAETRYLWGQLAPAEPSRFLEEIDPQFIETPRRVINHPGTLNRFKTDETPVSSTPDIPAVPRKLRKVSDLSDTPSDKDSKHASAEIDLIQAGMQVEHQQFGVGKVLAVEGAGSNRKATVFFPGVGQKQLILKFARLKIVQ